MENISKKNKPCKQKIFFVQKIAMENVIKKCVNGYPLAHIPTKNPQLLNDKSVHHMSPEDNLTKSTKNKYLPLFTDSN